MRASLALSVGAILLSSLASRSDAKQLCNGYAELCSKTYDKVVYPTTHNSFSFNPPNGLATNQFVDIPTQLQSGIRGLMFESFNATSGNPNDIELCHTSCVLLDGGPLSTTLKLLKTFLDANPNEVISIHWSNGGNLPAARFQAAFTAANLVSYTYTQAAGNKTWPTLAQMIASGKRIVNFIDTGADSSVPWLMPEFSYIFETPWFVLKDTAYPCTIDRPSTRQQMYVLNHFVYAQLVLGGENIDFPQPDLANQTNGPDLISHVNSCVSTFSQNPSFVAVDFYNVGDLFETVAKLNGVTYVAPASTSSSISSTNSTSSTGSTRSSSSGAVAGIRKSTLGAILAGCIGFGLMLL